MWRGSSGHGPSPSGGSHPDRTGSRRYQNRHHTSAPSNTAASKTTGSQLPSSPANPNPPPPPTDQFRPDPPDDQSVLDESRFEPPHHRPSEVEPRSSDDIFQSPPPRSVLPNQSPNELPSPVSLPSARSEERRVGK